MEQRTVVAIGGGGLSVESENLMLVEFLLSLARTTAPRVCFIPTASGDNADYVARFYRALSSLDCRTTDLQLFDRTIADLEAFMLESAGMNCWFEESVTDSFGKNPAPLSDGLGLLPGSACPHYDAEEERRPAYHRLIESGELGAGWAADDGAALVFSGTALIEVVSTRPDAAGYRVERAASGVIEQRLGARYLGGASSRERIGDRPF